MNRAIASSDSNRLHREITAILRAPEIRNRLVADSAEIGAGTPEQFAEFLRAEMVKWANVVKAAGIQVE
ncbi:MAG: hypothetical protein ABI547_05890 [Betaproteobacteria bacterium]